MQKVFVLLIAVLAVGGFIGYGIGTMNLNTVEQEAYNQGVEDQTELMADQTTYSGNPASLDIDFDDEEYDHSATVDADGGVAADVTVTNTLTITNDDETRTASGVYIMLMNPLSTTEGLDDDLEEEETEVSIDISGLTKKLFRDDDYTDGYLVGDLDPGDEYEIDISVTLLEAPDDTYTDGEEYECTIYIYQPDAGYVDPVDFTVTL